MSSAKDANNSSVFCRSALVLTSLEQNKQNYGETQWLLLYARGDQESFKVEWSQFKIWLIKTQLEGTVPPDLPPQWDLSGLLYGPGGTKRT